MKNKEVAQSPLAAEEWQLRILWEMHKKQPRPTAEQRRLLATQTGLDAKWITRWFKRANSPSKSKARSMPPNSAEPIVASGTSPSLFGDSLGHTFLFPGSDGVAPESGRSGSAATLELEYPDASPNLQANREHTIFYPHPQGANPALPQPHPDLVKHSQQTLEILTSPVFLASPFKMVPHLPAQHGRAICQIHGPHTSPSPGPLQTRYAHLNYVSESLAPAYSTEFGHPQRNLGPALAEAETAASTHVDAGFSAPDLVSPQLGPSSDPHLSMYWLLFDKDHDSSVDGQRTMGLVPRLTSVGERSHEPTARDPDASLILGQVGRHARVGAPDSLSISRCEVVQSGEAQKTDCAVEANRTKQGSGGK
ncbi:hypothetical protein BJV77DRAFT_1065013 [Russula vinacea]|nr:hypothetical protein BJV77DRAFT_1065013 [Russula vinacea]